MLLGPVIIMWVLRREKTLKMAWKNVYHKCTFQKRFQKGYLEEFGFTTVTIGQRKAHGIVIAL